MVSKRDNENTIETPKNQTTENQTEGTAINFSAVVAVVVDARMGDAMDELLSRL